MQKEEPGTLKLNLNGEKEEERAIAEITEQPAIPVQQEIVNPLKEELQPKLVETEAIPIVFFANQPTGEKPVQKQAEDVRTEWILSLPSDEEKKKENQSTNQKGVKPENSSPASAACRCAAAGR